jgi:hypothetical protein
MRLMLHKNEVRLRVLADASRLNRILPCEVADPPGYSEAAEYLYKRGLIRYGTGRLIATRRGLEVLERWKGARYAGAFDLPARGLKRERAAEKGRFLR